MQPWVTVDRARLGAQELVLARRGDEWVVRVGGHMLMTSRRTLSEIELALRAIDRAGTVRRMLIGGLGLGYTLRAALDRVSPQARVIVAELVPELVEWNRVHLAHLHNNALDDPRTEIANVDVFDAIKNSGKGSLDIIVLDVDNGPEPLAQAENHRLYSEKGTRLLLDSLAPGGVLGIWSASPFDPYVQRLTKAGFLNAEALRVPAYKGAGGKHTLFFGKKRG